MSEEMNFIPIGNFIITTCLLEKEDQDLLYTGKVQPKIKELQKVVAVGPRAEVKVGDWVLLDHGRFTKHVKVKSQIRAGVGGEDMIREEFVPPFVAIPGEDAPYLKINDREIEGVVPNYNKLPDNLKEFMTMKEFEESQDKIKKEALKLKKEFDAKKNYNTGESKGPAVITSSSKIKVNNR